MKSRFGELVEEFRRIEKRLEASFGSAVEPPEDMLRALDRQLADAFDQLLQMELSGSSELEARIVFLTGRVRNLAFDSKLANEMLDQIECDAKELVASFPPPELKVVANNGDEIDEDRVLTELCYTSHASHAMSPQDLSYLRDQAVAFNELNDITGVLTYDDKTQQFVQLLEGPKAKIDALFDRIIRDPRHQEVIIRFQSPIEQRLYRRWAMGLITTSEITAEIAANEPVLTWIDEFLGLDAGVPRTRGHRWMVDTISSLIA